MEQAVDSTPALVPNKTMNQTIGCMLSPYLNAYSRCRHDFLENDFRLLGEKRLGRRIQKSQRYLQHNILHPNRTRTAAFQLTDGPNFNDPPTLSQMPCPFWTGRQSDAMSKPKWSVTEPPQVEDGPQSACTFMPEFSCSIMVLCSPLRTSRDKDLQSK
jgi:hypothetical protein